MPPLAVAYCVCVDLELCNLVTLTYHTLWYCDVVSISLVEKEVYRR